MGNPILEQMHGRKNNISALMEVIKGKSPGEAVEAMRSVNPAFRKFYDENKGRPIEDVCRSYGVDPGTFRGLLK